MKPISLVALSLLVVIILLMIAFLVVYYGYAERLVKKKLKSNKIDIEINGTRPWDIQVYNKKLYRDLILNQSLGFGEGYMKGYWNTPNLKACLTVLFSSRVNDNQGTKRYHLRAKLNNMQSRSRSFEVGEHHYDIGNDLYLAMLDPYMQYSCGYWQTGAKTLEDAQEAKLQLIAEKLQLKPGMRVLEIGCGFGGLMKYLQTHYQVEIIGLTVSKEQKKFAKEYFNVDNIRLQDYRDFADQNQGQFDRVVSIAMFEAVGYKNYRDYFKAVQKMLKKDGLFLMHTIGNNVSVIKTDAWIDKYIFPNGMIPSIQQIGSNIEGLFKMEDWHNFGPSYATTLAEWNRRSKQFFLQTQNPKYDKTFQRMWDFYLTSCEVAFQLRQLQLWHVIMTPHQSIIHQHALTPYGGFRHYPKKIE